MRVLIINALDTKGGAAKASYRLHKSLLVQNIDSKMIVQNKTSNDSTVVGPRNKIQIAIAKMRPTLDSLPLIFYKSRNKTFFSPSWLPSSRLIKKINDMNADIVHLHWVNGGMLKIEDIAKIKAPIVWTLHDDWLFTGGCHIKWDCDKYKKTCGFCPVLGSKNEYDLSRRIYNRKKSIFKKIDNMTIVGVSKWLATCAKKSSLLNQKIINLPNPIDVHVFKPFEKIITRKLWNLPKDKKLVLFGSLDATSDINKGFHKLKEALHQIKHTNLEFVVFGSDAPKKPQDFGFKTHYLGYLYDDISLVTLYNACDVMVVPSLQESFGQTASESLSCSLPVVAFANSGLLDIVDHKINGYLAKPFDTKDLAYGIDWILDNENYDDLCKNAREKVLREFDSEIIAKKYIKLYEKVLTQK